MNRIDKIILGATPIERREIFSRIHDKLYARAIRIRKEYNYCQVKCGTCISARTRWANASEKKRNEELKAEPFDGCCAGCKYLGENGCTVEALNCRAWTCSVIQRLNRKSEMIKKLNRLNHAIQRWHLCAWRGSKEDAINSALQSYRNISFLRKMGIISLWS